MLCFYSGFIQYDYRIRTYFSGKYNNKLHQFESLPELLIKAYKYNGNKKVVEIKFPMKDKPSWNIPCQCFDLSNHDSKTLDILTDRLLKTLTQKNSKKQQSL